MSPELELVQQWLEHAAVDLRVAELSLADHPPVCKAACFHCQQAVEKSLKAFLIHRDMVFEWTHEIEYLLELCDKQDEAFSQWHPSASPLSVYAVRFRYPYAGPAPTPEEARAALDVARGVYEFVLERLPAEAHPRRQS